MIFEEGEVVVDLGLSLDEEWVEGLVTLVLPNERTLWAPLETVTWPRREGGMLNSFCV